MKKRAMAITLALFLLGGYLIFRFSPTPSPAPSPILVKASEGLDQYGFDLVLHPDEHQLAVTMNARIMNRWEAPLHDIVFRTYAGAYQSEETSPAATEELFDRCYPNGFSPGGFVLHDVLVNGQRVLATFDDDARTVMRLPVEAFAPGDWREVTLRMVLTIPDCLHRFGRGQGVWLLGNCLPILSGLEDGQWRTDPYLSIGDPFVSAVANYDIAFTAPAGFTVASGIPLTESGNGQFTGQGLALRDLALVVYERAHTASVWVGDAQISAVGVTQADADKSIQIAKAVLQYYNETYGAYPYPQLTVAAVPFAFSGMEYPGMLWVGKHLYAAGLEDSLELTVAHEIAHQWFYALVGSDQFRNPWQDEALSEHATLGYVKHRYGTQSYEALARIRIEAPMQESIRAGITPASPLDDFHSMEEYTSVVYGRGAAALQALDLHTNGRMDGFLKAYVERFAFLIASRAEFEIALKEYLEEDVQELLIDYLDTSI